MYQRTITAIVIFYAFFGMICWKAFGNDVNTVLTVSLPDTVLATLVQLFYSVAVIFTFPLQIFPASEIVVHLVQEMQCWRQLPRYAHVHGNESAISALPPQLADWQRRGLIVVLLVVLAMVAVLEMNNLGRVVALMGSLLGVPLAFCFPPLIHNRVVPHAPRFWNHVIAGIGFVAMMGATCITLITWGDDTAE